MTSQQSRGNHLLLHKCATLALGAVRYGGKFFLFYRPGCFGECAYTEPKKDYPPLLYGCLCAGAMIQNEREMPWHYIVEAWLFPLGIFSCFLVHAAFWQCFWRAQNPQEHKCYVLLFLLFFNFLQHSGNSVSTNAQFSGEDYLSHWFSAGTPSQRQAGQSICLKPP